MGEILEKIFSIILIVILMFFFPLLDSFERLDDLAYMSTYAATVKFVDTVKNSGTITPEMYYQFKQILDATGNTFQVEMVHRKSAFYPMVDTAGPGQYGFVELYDEYNTEQILCNMNILRVQSGALVTNNNFATYPLKSYDNFNVGDYFYVSVKNTNTTAATVVKKALYGMSISDSVIMVPYGGMIRNISTRL